MVEPYDFWFTPNFYRLSKELPHYEAVHLVVVAALDLLLARRSKYFDRGCRDRGQRGRRQAFRQRGRHPVRGRVSREAGRPQDAQRAGQL